MLLVGVTRYDIIQWHSQTNQNVHFTASDSPAGDKSVYCFNGMTLPTCLDRRCPYKYQCVLGLCVKTCELDTQCPGESMCFPPYCTSTCRNVSNYFYYVLIDDIDHGLSLSRQHASLFMCVFYWAYIIIVCSLGVYWSHRYKYVVSIVRFIYMSVHKKWLHMASYYGIKKT